jgi:glutathione synthase/RimK-type ligase-like ATP-grasp enzyme
MRQFIILGNPENRRVAFFQAALRQQDLPPAKVLSYQDYLSERVALSDVAAPNDVLRIESPGESFWVEQKMLALGAEANSASAATKLSADAAMSLSFDLGRILYPRQWYEGFCLVADRLERERVELGLSVMNHPEEIKVMFHKPKSHARFLEAQVPVAPSLGEISSYDELRDEMQRRDIERVFVKLSFGSSASGVVAYQADESGELAITSAELVRSRNEIKLYNSLRIRRYNKRSDIKAVLNYLLREGAIVEEWLPKAVFQGYPFDLRVVVIEGVAKHFVVRLGKSPMTNLHLGNARGDATLFRQELSEQSWREICQTCEAAFAAFPKGLYAGVDLLLTPTQEKVVLEINSFGDLLPNILCDGLDTYSAEIKAMLARHN